MRKLFSACITAYQKTLSPDHGFFKVFFPYGYCRFYPTCSEYGKQSINKYGSIKGLLFGCFRILKCHPWHQGGINQVR